jgi:hypothetical protein
MGTLSYLHLVEIDVYMEGECKTIEVEVVAPSKEAAQRGKETVLQIFEDATLIVLKGVKQCVP